MLVAALTATIAIKPAIAQERSSGPRPDTVKSILAELRQKRLLFPVPGRTKRLRDTFYQPRGETRIHRAIDILAPRGAPILSADAGRILKLHRSVAGGLMIYTADAAERFIYSYAHLDRYRAGLREGMPLARGDTIGYVGTTGNSPPDIPHLHFAILRSTNIKRWSRGTPVNPFAVFAVREGESDSEKR
ncbi:MAG: M23 family metallopeptidase [Gemmatimonadota bacterium]